MEKVKEKMKVTSAKMEEVSGKAKADMISAGFKAAHPFDHEKLGELEATRQQRREDAELTRAEKVARAKHVGEAAAGVAKEKGIGQGEEAAVGAGYGKGAGVGVPLSHSPLVEEGGGYGKKNGLGSGALTSSSSSSSSSSSEGASGDVEGLHSPAQETLPGAKGGYEEGLPGTGQEDTPWVTADHGYTGGLGAAGKHASSPLGMPGPSVEHDSGKPNVDSSGFEYGAQTTPYTEGEGAVGYPGGVKSQDGSFNSAKSQAGSAQDHGVEGEGDVRHGEHPTILSKLAAMVGYGTKTPEEPHSESTEDRAVETGYGTKDPYERDMLKTGPSAYEHTSASTSSYGA